MSVYAEWKHGIITDDQYYMACKREAAENEETEITWFCTNDSSDEDELCD